MTVPSATVVLDSISPMGDRLTTIAATMHRYVLAEFNTHRMFSRNSESSRAIPVLKRVERVESDLAMPTAFGRNVRGMQATTLLDADQSELAAWEWQVAAKHATRSATALAKLEVHKQVANRLLEPFSWHTVLVSSTEWENFWSLRISPNAQPEIDAVARAMYDAYHNSVPQVRNYHVPFNDDPDYHDFPSIVPMLSSLKQSVARCARTSYSNFAGESNLMADLTLFDHLAEQGHWSPFEHVAWHTPAIAEWTEPITRRKFRWNPAWGNFQGWEQLRFSEEINRVVRHKSLL